MLIQQHEKLKIVEEEKLAMLRKNSSDTSEEEIREIEDKISRIDIKIKGFLEELKKL